MTWTSLCFGAAHAAYVASVPNLFFPFPFFPLPRPSVRTKPDAAAAATADAADTAAADANGTDLGDDDDAIKNNMMRAAALAVEKAFVVEKAFEDDDTEDAVPGTEFTTLTPRRRGVAAKAVDIGGGAAGSPPMTPDPFAFQEDDKGEREEEGVVEGVAAAAADADANAAMEVDEDAAAMLPDADELLSAMMTGGSDAADVPSPSPSPSPSHSRSTSARARTKRTE